MPSPSAILEQRKNTYHLHPQTKMASTLFTVLIFGFRGADKTVEEYRDHYDNIHVPLARSLTGPWFPLSHTRHYTGLNATLDAGSADVDWDSLAVLTFNNETHAGTFSYLLSQVPENAEKIHEDELKFMREEGPEMVIVGPYTSVTLPVGAEEEKPEEY